MYEFLNLPSEVTLNFMASTFSEDEIERIGDLFKQTDKNGDGVLTVEEMK